MKPMQAIVEHIHFVGIGGCGMSAIADVLLSKGYKVTGSDVVENKATLYLRSRGADIFIGHRAENIQGADRLVLSSAVAKDNPEIIAALNQNVPSVLRAQMLAEIMEEKIAIAIAGTHGKTTTTSLITSIFQKANLDPTYLIGGTLHQSGSNAGYGLGDYCIAEADESDASFLCLNPKIAVLTNIDVDHLWFYQSDFSALKKGFLDFLARLSDDGLLVICQDDPVNKEILPMINKPMISYGFSNEAQVQIKDYRQYGAKSHFQLQFQEQQKHINIVLNLPGRHNALNAAAAATVALRVGINDITIQTALQTFAGVGRRFQIRGEYMVDNKKALLVDDYGHHPREIAATLAAARAAWPKRRIVLVFQPHRYSRTQNLFDYFAQVLASADCLILLDIYSAGEKPLPGINGDTLMQTVKNHKNLPGVVVKKEEKLESILANVVQDNDVLLLQGAGDIGIMAAQLVP